MGMSDTVTVVTWTSATLSVWGSMRMSGTVTVATWISPSTVPTSGEVVCEIRGNASAPLFSLPAL